MLYAYDRNRDRELVPRPLDCLDWVRDCLRENYEQYNNEHLHCNGAFWKGRGGWAVNLGVKFGDNLRWFFSWSLMLHTRWNIVMELRWIRWFRWRLESFDSFELKRWFLKQESLQVIIDRIIWSLSSYTFHGLFYHIYRSKIWTNASIYESMHIRSWMGLLLTLAKMGSQSLGIMMSYALADRNRFLDEIQQSSKHRFRESSSQQSIFPP